ncbi:DUF4132 domain-containing protein [Nocardia bovistercoris]|uniref:DUF4132 domain-containing protein n=1 Tax=Nocardia bovistercoris TaxID=2785916 RepID=A0A931IH02_9NOCA|nr:DUF4132 domain-containing protein [Nocardia bovistercoris]
MHDPVTDRHAAPGSHVLASSPVWAVSAITSAPGPNSVPNEPGTPNDESARATTELEAAMASAHIWSAKEFRTEILADPVRHAVARRLVWVRLDRRGRPTGSFRPCPDGGAHDLRGLPASVDGPRIAVAHPLHLGADIPHWARNLAADGLTQPFDQLHRAIYRLAPDEAESTALARFADRMVATAALLRLEDSGWRRSAPADGGMHDYLFRPVGADLQVLIVLDDGIDATDPLLIPEQVLAAVELTARPARSWMHRCGDTRFAVLDPITASEILRDLETLLD